MSVDKVILRKHFLSQRMALSPREWTAKSQQICETLESLPAFNQAKTILAYSTHQNEPDLYPLFARHDKVWGLPRCQKKELIWHQCHPIQQAEHIKLDKFGILTPPATFPKITPEEVDLILIPSLALDRQGYRLGYGGGYYDRLLSTSDWQHCLTIGIVFDFALVEKLPTQAWDIKLSAYCTDKTVTWIRYR